jgi:hypothetical protein
MCASCHGLLRFSTYQDYPHISSSLVQLIKAFQAASAIIEHVVAQMLQGVKYKFGCILGAHASKMLEDPSYRIRSLQKQYIESFCYTHCSSAKLRQFLES